jgi:phosphoribosylformylglycinamidine synthase
MIRRLIVGSNVGGSAVCTIYNFEGIKKKDLKKIESIFHNSVTEKIIKKKKELPKEKFLEVMYQTGVVDPEQSSIIDVCRKKGVKVDAAKVGKRYYGEAIAKAIVNKQIHLTFDKEPDLKTLKPRGSRKGMELINFNSLSDEGLMTLSKQRKLNLSLEQMKKIAEFQNRSKLSAFTDVTPEVFGARWSDHCEHLTWKILKLFPILKGATKRINNPNLVSAFVDNAGGWMFYDGLVIVFKLETHNSPTQNEPYGGQETKLGGVLRDILEYALGAKPIGNIEMTVVGEFEGKRYPHLVEHTLSPQIIAKETIRAISDYGNRMGVSMLRSRMSSHPDFGGKPFALGGSVGITTLEASQKGVPKIGDLIVLIGGKTGNDGLHGATVSSGEMSAEVDVGATCHEQIGNAFEEQKMMRANLEIRDKECARARTDCGAAGLTSAVGEIGEDVEGGKSGVIINLAKVPLKCANLENWQIALSESQERCVHVIKPEKLEEALEIYHRHEVEATVIGHITGNGRFQMVYDDSNNSKLDVDSSCEVALDIPYEYFKECPLPKIKVIKPRRNKKKIKFPKINFQNIEEMAEKVVGHFDVCNQISATSRYDSTVQGITSQGPLYGEDQNIPSSLAVLKPVFGKNYGLTVSQSFSPWQFEADPVNASINAMLDAVVAQVVAGVKVKDICLADNFYIASLDPYAFWYLKEQVKAIANLSVKLGTPFITGKDSNFGSSTFGGITVNVPASVCITAMGKIKNVKKLILHQWKDFNSFLYLLGPRTTLLDGSILSASLGITGNRLETVNLKEAKSFVYALENFVSTGMVKSAVPVNRGGIIQRLFEGVEASGFEVQTELCEELFPEHHGAVLVEVDRSNFKLLEENYKELNPLRVGYLTYRSKQISFRNGKSLNQKRLFDAWNTTFERKVLR